jgi:hypothetical protein
MSGMLLAESAILIHFQPVRIVLFIFHGVVIPLLAFRAGQRYLHAHPFNLRYV